MPYIKNYISKIESVYKGVKIQVVSTVEPPNTVITYIFGFPIKEQTGIDLVDAYEEAKKEVDNVEKISPFT